MAQENHHPRSHSENEAIPSHGIAINLPDSEHPSRRQPIKQMSAPAYPSPVRHHQRTASKSKGVKETLNARSHYGSSDDNDGASVHRINQYIIKQEIGRGSYGAVHLAVDQYGHEFAVKEFSKARLRKRAQSTLLRKPNQTRQPGHLAAGTGFNSPLHRLSSADKLDQLNNTANNSLSLIKEEIAIMKKLNHNNLVNLIEVLDDPQEDSLYMVLEMCKKGVVMKVGLDERAEPYEEEACRCWFRDMILGIEYLHAQGIIHRDIKPDNCLITEDDVLKVVDFGVSEMFEHSSDMATAKSAGSPAFMPPELCVAKHGQVSGRAADIWSMGVTLYCLRYGHIPFEKPNMLELYNSIRNDDLHLDDEKDGKFEDLMRRLLEKDPEKRITMDELRKHPWVTQSGADPLLSTEENCADILDPPTDAEMEQAITGNMAHLMAVMRAVKRFKALLLRKRPDALAIFGRESRMVAPPHAIRGGSESKGSPDRRPLTSILVTDGASHDTPANEGPEKLPREMETVNTHSPDPADLAPDPGSTHQEEGETTAHFKQRLEAASHNPSTDPAFHPVPSNDNRKLTFLQDDHAKGHAHDPLTDTIFLSIGPNATSPTSTAAVEDPDAAPIIVSESPPGIDENIYEQAYQDEMTRILAARGQSANIYLTRRVEHRDDLRAHSSVLDGGKKAVPGLASRWGGQAGHGAEGQRSGLAALVEKARSQATQGEQGGSAPGGEESVSLDRGKEMVGKVEAAKGAMPGVPGAFPATPAEEGA